jgi:hypothetical protein
MLAARCREGLLDEAAENGFFAPVGIDYGLERKVSLVLSCGGDDRLPDSQAGSPELLSLTGIGFGSIIKI